MNVKDVLIESELEKFKRQKLCEHCGGPIPGDMLETLFEKQLALAKKYDLTTAPIQTKTGQNQARTSAYFMVEELFEAMNCLKNRPWTQTELDTDLTHFHEELADSFLFFILLCSQTGLDAETLFKTSLKKIKVNNFRYKSHY